MAAPVSVIIPVLDGEKFIREALSSVQRQTMLPIEIIVVDDGSTDRTATIVREIPNIRCLVQDHGGQAMARNVGVDHATMPFVAFLDADDLWPAEKLARQMSLFDREPQLDAVFGHAVEFRDHDTDGYIVPLGPPVPARVPGAMLIRRDSFLRIGYFSFAPDRANSVPLRTGEVIDWNSRAVDGGLHMSLHPDVVLWRRHHATNLGRIMADPGKDYLAVLRTVLARRRGHPGKRTGEHDLVAQRANKLE